MMMSLINRDVQERSECWEKIMSSVWDMLNLRWDSQFKMSIRL